MPTTAASYRKAGSRPTPRKARKILRHGSVRGKKLTKPQRGFFGAAAGKRGA